MANANTLPADTLRSSSLSYSGHGVGEVNTTALYNHQIPVGTVTDTGASTVKGTCSQLVM